MTEALSRRLGAPAILQRYSRLVQDCNRPPDAPSAMPEVSELTAIPGNAGLTAEEIQEMCGRFKAGLDAAWAEMEGGALAAE